MSNLSIAFVGIRKNWDNLEQRNYFKQFFKYHIELPWYYAYYGKNAVTIVTDTFDDYLEIFDDESYSYLECITEKEFINSNREYDIIIHWRKWFDHLYKKNSINVINSQDHSYGSDWLNTLNEALESHKCDGILCFPTWHQRRLGEEFSKLNIKPRLISGLTLGVDTEIYHPEIKDPYSLLWASDPGRGLHAAIELTLKLFSIDNRYKLNICWPDYYHDTSYNIIHPAIKMHRNLDNSEKLWSLFNTSGFLPYTSTFLEPSSRAHRQAMAAGCVVLYPKNMGSPSELTQYPDIIVEDINKWVNIIHNMSHDEQLLIATSARKYAESENWEVQSKRFNDFFNDKLKKGWN